MRANDGMAKDTRKNDVIYKITAPHKGLLFMIIGDIIKCYNYCRHKAE
jgi:hypothetical protein